MTDRTYTAADMREAFIAGVDWQRQQGVELVGQSVHPKSGDRSSEAERRWPTLVLDEDGNPRP